MWNFPRMMETFLFALALSGLCVAIHKDYYYFKTLLTWTEAQSFCRYTYSDLATVENPDVNKVITNIEDLHFLWIGYRDDLRIWKWALGNVRFDNDIDYDSWSLYEPSDQRSGSRCAVITQAGYWHDISCASLRFAVCFYEKGLPTYVFVETAMTWYQAREHCRSHYTDLVSVRSMYENYDVFPLVTGDAWIGLYRQPWAWSDSSSSNFTNWGDAESADIAGMTSCATASTVTGLWYQADCEEEHYFICQAVSYSQSSTFTVQDKALATSTYRLKFESEEDVSDPAARYQILKQLHGKLKEHTLADLSLQWIRTDGPISDTTQEQDKCSPVYSK